MGTEALIKVVRNYPILYDSNHPDHRSISKKNAVWEEAGGFLNMTGDEVKKKWKNLRDSYAKYLKCVKSGNQYTTKNYKKWPWAKHLEAFVPDVLTGASDSAAAEGSQDESFNQQNMEIEGKNLLTAFKLEMQSSDKSDTEEKEPIVPDNCEVKIPRKRTRVAQENGLQEVTSLLNMFPKTEFDGNDYLFLGYSRMLKKFSPMRQALVRLKMAKLFAKQEVEQIKSGDAEVRLSSSSSSSNSSSSDSPPSSPVP